MALNQDAPFWQVEEELCRVIASADRWLTVSEAIKAMMQARRLYRSMKNETAESGGDTLRRAMEQSKVAAAQSEWRSLGKIQGCL